VGCLGGVGGARGGEGGADLEGGVRGHLIGGMVFGGCEEWANSIKKSKQLSGYMTSSLTFLKARVYDFKDCSLLISSFRCCLW